MRILHVYAGPFPSFQGTPTLVGQVCGQLAAAGHDNHLFCYAHGEAPEPTFVTVHRIADWPHFRGDRAGPAWQKPLLDYQLARQLPKLVRALKPDIIHAHHYEALWVCRLAVPHRHPPLVCHLHALLAPELATYAPRPFHPVLRSVGRAIDARWPRLADGVIALNTPVYRQLQNSGIPESKLALARPPLPKDVSLPSPAMPPSPVGTMTVYYAGNLDAYQELHHLWNCLQQSPLRRRTDFTVKIFTAASSNALRVDLDRRQLTSRVRIHPLGPFSELQKRLQPADIAVIPRSRPGGVPIKLINALASGHAVLMDDHLADGLQHGRDVCTVDMTDVSAMQTALSRLLDDTPLRHHLARNAPAAANKLFDARISTQAIEGLYATVAHRAQTDDALTFPTDVGRYLP